MKKRSTAVIGAFVLLTGVFPVGCSQPEKDIIGIIGAMDNEVDSLKQAADIKNTVRIAEMEFCEGTLEDKDVVIVKCGMCCEMEGGAVAQTCYLNSTPFVIIRAISDKSDETEIVDYKKFEAKAAADCAKIVENMIDKL